MPKHTFLLLLLSVLLFSPLATHAQSGFSLLVNPPLPEPGDTYEVTAGILGTNVRSFSWFADGREISDLANKKTVSLTASDTQTRITARVTLVNGTQLEASKIISPARVDLHINAHTLTPVFYTGASLPASGAEVTATALVFKKGQPVSNGLSYAWTLNGKIQNGGPIRGGNSISYVPSFEDETLISVEVFDAQNKKIAEEAQLIPVVDPELYFYENNPLRGLSPVALLNPHIFIGDEVNIRGEAYYLNNALDPRTTFTEWKINGSKATASSQDGQEITLRKEGNNGSSELSFHIRDLKQLLHGVQNAITIRF
jgi:hypothetical protein